MDKSFRSPRYGTMVWVILFLAFLFPGETHSAPLEIEIGMDEVFSTHVASMDTFMELDFGDLDLAVGGNVTGYLEEPDKREQRLEEVAVSLKRGSVRLSAGLGQPRWEYAGFCSVMLSGEAPGFWHGSFQYEADSFSYDKFVGYMENGFISGHRLGIRPIRGVELGIKEVARYSQDFAGSWTVCLPFYPLYLTKYIPGTDGTHDNMEIGLDIRVDGLKSVKLYGDLHVTEWPMAPDSPQVPLYAAQLGVRAKEPFFGGEATVEYLRLTNYLYTHPTLDYEYGGVPLGHPLGPDADELDISLDFPMTSKWDLLVGYTYQRKGEGEIGDSWTAIPREEAEENLFLSGVVQKSRVFHLGAVLYIRDNLKVWGRVSLARIENYGHVPGVTKWRPGAELSVRWYAF